MTPRRFEWNFRRNLCQISAKYWHEEKTWTATRYYYWDWAFILPARIQPITAPPVWLPASMVHHRTPQSGLIAWSKLHADNRSILDACLTTETKARLLAFLGCLCGSELIGRVDGLHNRLGSCWHSLFAGWFPTGTAISSPYCRITTPLTEPCLHYSRTRLLNNTLRGRSHHRFT